MKSPFNKKMLFVLYMRNTNSCWDAGHFFYVQIKPGGTKKVLR